MALTRKLLASMEIPAEKVDEIITAHSETVNALKSEIDTLKAEAVDVADLKEKLDKATKEIEATKLGDWEKKYKDLKTEFDTFKENTEKKETKSKKESAYKDILKKAGVSEKRIDAIMKVSGTKVDELDFDEKGEVKDADKLVEGVKTEWADFIVTTGEKGAGTATPPESNGGSGADDKKPTRAQQLAAKYHENLYGSRKEN